MIEDEELRSLFSAESDEHLGALEAGLLALEQGRGDSTTLDQVFRDAHSLKGAARMLELEDIQTLMHSMEELLRSARDHQQSPDAAALTALYQALDGARALAAEAVTGKPANVALLALIDALKAVGIDPSKAATTSPISLPSAHTDEPPCPIDGPSLLPAGATGAIAVDSDAAADTGMHSPCAQADTIRVDIRKLDELLRLCGELIVTQQRTARIDDGLDHLSADLNELRQDRLRLARGDQDPSRTIERLAGLVLRSGGLRDRLREDSEKLQGLTQQIADAVRDARLLPLATLFALFPRMVRDIAQQESKQVELVIEGGSTSADKRIIEQLKDPLMHILRNAVHHGIELPEQRRAAGKPERGQIRLRAQRSGSAVQIEISDDGRGVDPGQVRSALARLANAKHSDSAATASSAADDAQQEHQVQLLKSLFLPGLSTEQLITDVSGRGVGLDVVRNSIEALKGSIQAASEHGKGFQLHLELPVTLATTRILLLQVGEFLLGLPMDAVQTLFRPRPDSLYRLEGRPTLDYAGQALSVIELARLMELGAAMPYEDPPDHCVVVGQSEQRIALLVDRIVGTEEVLLKPIGGVLRRVRGIAGATILSSGEVCPVLAANDLIKAVQLDASGRSGLGPGGPGAGLAQGPRDQTEGETERQHHLLLVEDSMLTRVQEKRLLESAGYRVTIAVDGVEALERLRPPPARIGTASARKADRFDAVITDVNMQRMDGLRLTEQIRADPRLRSLPVVLVTSLASEADQRRGLEAGANAYITKGGFDNRLLLSTLERLV